MHVCHLSGLELSLKSQNPNSIPVLIAVSEPSINGFFNALLAFVTFKMAINPWIQSTRIDKSWIKMWSSKHFVIFLTLVFAAVVSCDDQNKDTLDATKNSGGRLEGKQIGVAGYGAGWGMGRGGWLGGGRGTGGGYGGGPGGGRGEGGGWGGIGPGPAGGTSGGGWGGGGSPGWLGGGGLGGLIPGIGSGGGGIPGIGGGGTPGIGGGGGGIPGIGRGAGGIPGWGGGIGKKEKEDGHD